MTNVLEVGAAPELEPTERIELLLRDLRSGPDGLSDREAARRRVVDGPNELRRRGGRRISIDEGDRYGRASALELARRLAHLAGADVRAITVLTPKVVLWPAAAWDTARSGEDASALQSDDRLLAGIAAELPDDVAPETMVGTPWTELTARSADPDLLVVGSRTRGPVRRLLFGSTSTTLGRHAACALLVAPAGARGTADGELRAGAPTVAS